MRNKFTVVFILLLVFGLALFLTGCNGHPEDVQVLTTRLDESDHLLWVYAPQKANRWILSSNGNILAENETEQMKEYTSFDIEKIKEYEEIKVRVFEDDKFLCETMYSQKLEYTYDKEESVVKLFTPKKAEKVVWEFNSYVYYQGSSENGHQFFLKLDLFKDRTESGTYVVLVQAYDVNENPLYPEKKQMEIEIQY